MYNNDNIDNWPWTKVVVAGILMGLAMLALLMAASFLQDFFTR